jgi:gluconolactonase
VYFTDQPNDAILHWDPTTDDVTVWRTPSGRANGMEFDREGRLVACADGANELVRFEADGRVTTLVAAFDGTLLNGPNDVWIAPNGDAYFTDPWYRRSHWRDHPVERRRSDPRPEQATEAVYRFIPSTMAVERVAEGFVRPNGITGSPDGATLYVADIGANCTYAFERASDGSLRDRRLFVRQGSDGMTVDHKGNVYLTGNGVTIVAPTGEVVGHIAVPRPWTSNVTFAGPDRTTLIITAGESLFAVPMSVGGVRE